MPISYEDFKKLELRVATIKKAERIEESEKLLVLHIELQDETRQIVAGIGTQYTPESLIGKQIIVVANLEPKTLMGHESQGMLLAANGENGPVLLQPEKETPLGATIQ